jgi:hypothetical protein
MRGEVPGPGGEGLILLAVEGCQTSLDQALDLLGDGSETRPNSIF